MNMIFIKNKDGVINEKYSIFIFDTYLIFFCNYTTILIINWFFTYIIKSLS